MSSPVRLSPRPSSASSSSPVSPHFASSSQPPCSSLANLYSRSICPLPTPPATSLPPLATLYSIVSVKSPPPLSPPLSLSLSLHSELFLRQFVSSHFSPCSIPLSPHSPNPASPQGVNGRCDGMMSKRRSSVSVNDCQLGQTHCRKSERVWIPFFFFYLSLSDLHLYSVYSPIHALPPYMV